MKIVDKRTECKHCTLGIGDAFTFKGSLYLKVAQNLFFDLNHNFIEDEENLFSESDDIIKVALEVHIL